FPKKRETRAPLVAELLPYQALLPEKYHYLLDAPRQDNDGNPAIIRYSRKTKEQYVMTEQDGKATGWSAWYNAGKWQVDEKKKAAKKYRLLNLKNPACRVFLRPGTGIPCALSHA